MTFGVGPLGRELGHILTFHMNGLDEYLSNGYLDTYTGCPQISSWLTYYLNAARNPDCSTWSSQWTFAMLKRLFFHYCPTS